MTGPSHAAETLVHQSGDARAVRRALARVARHVWWRRAVRWGLRAIAAGLGTIILGLLAHALGLLPEPRGAQLAWAGTAVAVIVILPALRPVDLRSAAATADRCCSLDERFTTALEVIGRPGVMERLVVRDAARSALDVDPGRLPRPAYARDASVVVTTIVIATVLWLHPAAGSRATARPGPRTATGVVAAVGVRAEHRDGGAVSRPSTTALDDARHLDPSAARPAPDAEPRDMGARDEPSAARRHPSSTTADALAAGRATFPVDSPRTDARGDASDAAGGVAGAGAATGDGEISADAPDVNRAAALGHTVSAAGARGAGSALREGSMPQRRDAPTVEGGEEDARGVPASGATVRPSSRPAVPPALRSYVERYFEALRAPGPGPR